jgi:hypothetical protein
MGLNEDNVFNRHFLQERPIRIEIFYILIFKHKDLISTQKKVETRENIEEQK